MSEKTSFTINIDAKFGIAQENLGLEIFQVLDDIALGLFQTVSLVWTCTLEYLINVGVRLLIFRQISSHYALIPYPTFIDFIEKVHQVTLLFILLN